MESITNEIATYLFGDSSDMCVELLRDVEVSNFVQSPCLSLLLSKSISTLILLSSLLIKLPTFITIYKNSSMKGFALGSIYGEVILFSNAAFYGIKMKFPFTSYGETVIQLAISLLLTISHTYYNPKNGRSSLILPPLFYAFYVFLVVGVVTRDMAWILPRLNWPMVVYARGAQIMMNYDRKSTGDQSPITIAMQAGGSAVRIFTTVVMIGFDVSMLTGYCLGTGLNTVLLGQWFIYSKYGRKWIGVEVEDKVDEAMDGSETVKKLSKGRATKSDKKTPERKTRSRSRKSTVKKSNVNDMTPVRRSTRVRKKKVL